MVRRVMESLTEDELARLKQFTNGYGRIQYACTLSKVPMSSMRKILISGAGIMDNIKKIRSMLSKNSIGANLQQITENQNTVA
jgi:hypothetical protein